jgi:hypothetical protein
MRHCSVKNAKNVPSNMVIDDVYEEVIDIVDE